MDNCTCYTTQSQYDDFPGSYTDYHTCDNCNKKLELKNKIKKEELKSHLEYINSIETLNFVPIKNALTKYRNTTSISNSDKWIVNNLRSRTYTVLQVHKKNNRWICSKERLDEIDFKVFR